MCEHVRTKSFFKFVKEPHCLLKLTLVDWNRVLGFVLGIV